LSQGIVSSGFAPILLKKSPLAHEQNSSGPLVRPTCVVLKLDQQGFAKNMTKGPRTTAQDHEQAEAHRQRGEDCKVLPNPEASP
jgi:hypothetical protein